MRRGLVVTRGTFTTDETACFRRRPYISAGSRRINSVSAIKMPREDWVRSESMLVALRHAWSSTKAVASFISSVTVRPKHLRRGGGRRKFKTRAEEVACWGRCASAGVGVCDGRTWHWPTSPCPPCDGAIASWCSHSSSSYPSVRSCYSPFQVGVRRSWRTTSLRKLVIPLFLHLLLLLLTHSEKTTVLRTSSEPVAKSTFRKN